MKNSFYYVCRAALFHPSIQEVYELYKSLDRKQSFRIICYKYSKTGNFRPTTKFPRRGDICKITFAQNQIEIYYPFPRIRSDKDIIYEFRANATFYADKILSSHVNPRDMNQMILPAEMEQYKENGRFSMTKKIESTTVPSGTFHYFVFSVAKNSKPMALQVWQGQNKRILTY